MKYFFSDFDGTLLQNNQIDHSTIDKVKSFVSKGNKFILTTGRVDPDVKLIEKEIGRGEYRISQNGSVIKDIHDNIVNKELISKSIITQLTDYIYDTILPLNEVVSIEVSDCNQRYSNVEREYFFKHAFTHPIVIDKNIRNAIPSLDCTLFLIIANNEIIFPSIIQEIKELFGESIYAVKTSPGCLEILSENASKGRAILHLQDKLNIKKEDIIVAGDSYNDISMFKRYSNSFVMETSSQDVQYHAKHIVSSVKEALEKLGY